MSTRRRFHPFVMLLLAASLMAAGPSHAASDFERTLLRLAERALEEGDLAAAGGRYRRVLNANPDSARAQAGLGAVALAKGDAALAERSFEAALGLDPSRPEPYLGLAELALAGGDEHRGRARLRAGLVHAPRDVRLHQRLFEITGLAPPEAMGKVAPARVGVLAEAHPYDPRVQLAVARLALAADDETAARGALETALLVADLAPGTAPKAAALLAAVDREERRFVPVHLYADESVREKPGFEFELRLAFGRAAKTLAPMLHTTFVPVSISPFSTARVPSDLTSIHNAMLASLERPPLQGMLAGFTRRESPRTRTASRKGQATYLGREVVMRIDPSDRKGRTLVHELLHLYGAIHLAEIPSIMNPGGSVWSLDGYNAQIAEAVGTRRFGPGGIERNVFDRVDEPALAKALMAAIAVNVHFRNEGLREARETAQTSRVVAGMEARKAMGQDEHLAQVARITAALLLRLERPVEAVRMMDNAVRLFGPATPQGRAARAEADDLRRVYKSFLGN